MPEFYRWEGNELLLNLYVQPNAKHNELVGQYGDKLKIRITALPVDNKANKHLIKFLAKEFAVTASHITFIRGEKSKNKAYSNHKSRPTPRSYFSINITFLTKLVA